MCKPLGQEKVKPVQLMRPLESSSATLDSVGSISSLRRMIRRSHRWIVISLWSRHLLAHFSDIIMVVLEGRLLDAQVLLLIDSEVASLQLGGDAIEKGSPTRSRHVIRLL